MEILKNFGIEWPLLVAQIINFLIIFYVLKRFLYRPIFGLLKKRADTIKEGLEKAEEGKKSLDNALIKEKKIIKEAQETAQKIIHDAREQAQTLSKETEEKAKKHADRMIEDAKVQIDLDVRKAEQQLNKKIAKLSVEFLKKSLPDLFTSQEQSAIVAKAVKQLEKQPN